MKIGGVCFFCIKKLWQVIATMIVVVAVVISVLKYTLPYLDSYRNDIQDLVREKYNAEIYIGSISAGWEGVGPAILLQNISISPNEAAPLDLVIKETRIKLDFWRTVSTWQLTSDYFVLDGVVATVDGKSLIQASDKPSEAPIVDALSELFLDHLKQFSVINSQIKLNTPSNAKQHISIEELTWYNDQQRHQAVGEFTLGEYAANTLSFVLDLQGTRRKDLSGQLYVEAVELDISPWLHQFVSKQTDIEYSNINFRSWATIEKGVFKQAQIDLADNQIVWRKAKQTQKLQFGQGQMMWTPSLLGWEVASNDIQFVFDDSRWPSINVNLQKNAEQFDFYFSQWSVDETLKLLTLVDVDPQVTKALDDYQPEGIIHDFYVQLRASDDWRLTGLFAEFGWANVGDVPGAKMLSGHFGMAPDAGWLKVDGVDGFLLTGKLFPEEIYYENLDISLDFKTNERGQWQIFGHDIWVHNKDIDLVAEFNLNLADEPEIAFYAELSGSDLNMANKYYPPEYMGQETIDYLNGAIKAGQLDMAQMIWSGKLGSFPYDNDDGIFLINVLVSEVDFLFEPGWPVLSNIEGELIFRNDTLTIVPSSGYFLDIDVADRVTAIIPSLSEGMWLDLDISARVAPQKVAKLFRASPLRDIFNPVFEQLTINNEVIASSQIRIPLEEQGFDDNLDYKGVVHFADNTLDIATPGMTLTEVSGIFRFDKERIWTEVFNGKWIGQPLKVSLVGKQEQDDYVLAINTKVDVDSQSLLKTTKDPFEPYIFGAIPVDVAIDLRFPEQGVRFDVEATSDLLQTRFDLPPPYQKAEGVVAPLMMKIKGDEISTLVTANIDDRLYFNGILPNDQSTFSQAHLILGNDDLGLSGDGFKISVDIDKAEVMPWYDFIFHLVENVDAKQGDPLLPVPGLISGKVGQLSGFSHKLNSVNFDLTEGNGSWDLDLTAKETHTVVHIDRDWDGKGILIKSDYLRLVSQQDSDEEDVSIDSAELIAKFPPIDFSCLDCRYDDYNLERLDIETVVDNNTLKFNKFNINKGKHQFQGKGEWIGDRGNGMSSFSGRLTSDNIGNLLSEYDLTSTVKDSNARLDVLANWAGGPHQFNLPSLGGEIKWNLGEGHLTEVSDKGSRLLSLLSLDSIVRKLKLDFRDVFSKGFFYNSMNGSMLIESGIAYTDNTEIDGVPGNLSIAGNVNLVDQQMSYDAVFYPKVTSSLPVIIGWMVNPISGIAALALDQMLESTKVVAAVHFTITGKIADPVVTEVDRKSKDIQLPKTAVRPQVIPSEVERNRKFAEQEPAAKPPTSKPQGRQQDNEIDPGTGGNN